MRKLIILVTLFIPFFCLAEQARLNKAIAAFEQAPATIQAVQKWEREGYSQKGTSGALINGMMGDEGLDASYFISIYLEKGDKPWERQAKFIAGLVVISMGHVQFVKAIDNAMAERVLFGMQ